jgi:hypothetical protein
MYCTACNWGSRLYQIVAEGCPELWNLDVSGTDISDSMFIQILRCRNLKTLLMRDCDLNQIDLNLIPTDISSLLYLYIGPFFQLREDVINEVRATMPNLVIKQASHFCDEANIFPLGLSSLPNTFSGPVCSRKLGNNFVMST